MAPGATLFLNSGSMVVNTDNTARNKLTGTVQLNSNSQLNISANIVGSGFTLAGTGGVNGGGTLNGRVVGPGSISVPNLYGPHSPTLAARLSGGVSIGFVETTATLKIGVSNLVPLIASLAGTLKVLPGAAFTVSVEATAVGTARLDTIGTGSVSGLYKIAAGGNLVFSGNVTAGGSFTLDVVNAGTSATLSSAAVIGIPLGASMFIGPGLVIAAATRIAGGGSLQFVHRITGTRRFVPR